MKFSQLIICAVYISIAFGLAYVMTALIKDADKNTFLIILYGNITTLALVELVAKNHK